MFLLDFLFGIILFTISINLLKPFILEKRIPRLVMEKRAISKEETKEGTVYTFYLSLKEDPLNAFKMEPSFKYIDYLKFKKKKKIPVIIYLDQYNNEIIEFDHTRRQFKVGLILFIISIGLGLISILELLSIIHI